MEIWKDIPGYEGLYQVSNCGRVKSLKRFRVPKDRILSNGVTHGNYRLVGLYDGKGDNRSVSVHRLVAETFLEKLEHHEVVNHKDGNPANNHVDNLEWCTYSENTLHAHRMGLSVTPNPKKMIRVKQFSIGGDLIAEYESLHEAAEKISRSQSTIRNCLHGITKTGGGFVWKYAE